MELLLAFRREFLGFSTSIPHHHYTWALAACQYVATFPPEVSRHPAICLLACAAAAASAAKAAAGGHVCRCSNFTQQEELQLPLAVTPLEHLLLGLHVLLGRLLLPERCVNWKA